MKVTIILNIMLASLLSIVSCSTDDEKLLDTGTDTETENPTPGTGVAETVLMTIGENEVRIKMEDNEAARDFISRLPMEITLEDYNNVTEKIYHIEPELKLGDTPRGCSPIPGDVTIYIPWGNIAIFCKEWRYSEDLTKIGHIENDGIALLQRAGDIKVSLKLDKQDK